MRRSMIFPRWPFPSAEMNAYISPPPATPVHSGSVASTHRQPNGIAWLLVTVKWCIQNWRCDAELLF